ncbi:MAG: ATP-binding protein [Oscillospiraceae bacterium]|nr:ATP-binding protein [Oscillospiraceae bacterium]
MGKKIILGMLLLNAVSVILSAVFFTFALAGAPGGEILSEIAYILPLTLLIIIINSAVCLLLSKRLTQKIFKTINKIDFDFNGDAEIYEELSPFMKTINEQKKQIREQLSALRDKNDTIDAIIKNMRAGILLLDKNQVVLTANKGVVKFLDNVENSRSLVGKNILSVVREVNFHSCIRKALAGEQCNLTSHYGKTEVETFFSPVKSGEIIEGLVIFFLDVTEKNSAEKMRREFSANVSHELKTPLTAILGMSEMLDEGMVKQEDIVNFIGVIRSEASRLLRLIEDIIKLSELDEGITGSSFEEFDVGVVAKETAQRLASLADEKNVTIITEGGGIIKGNKILIEEMLYNLTDNGIKYNKTGGEVKVTVNVTQKSTEFMVSDTGIGIEKEHLSRIFERFYRADKSRSKKTGGTGLGLSIVKHIAEYHGGSVDIKSELGVGTDVAVRI